jgi:peptidyl-prolyl cis-trans isomerase SurA
MNYLRMCLSSFPPLAFLLFLLLPASAPKAEMVDRIIAIVNEDIITLSDLEREGAALFNRIREQAPPDQRQMAMAQAREEILSSLIDRRIVEQRAKKLGISVSSEEADNAVNSVIARNNSTPEEFRQQLARMGTNSNEYREHLRSQVLQEKLIDYEIRSRVVITEEKMKEHYEKKYSGNTREEAYHILQMGFSWQEDTPEAKAAARQRAEEARALAEAGQDFRTLARQFSNLPSAADGGDIGIFKKEELSDAMKSSILALKPGQLSPVEKTPFGFQFFKLLSNRGDVRLQAPYEAVKDEIRQTLLEEALNAQFQKWVRELREQAYIKKTL